MSTNVYEFRHSIPNARMEFMSVGKSAATPVVDNDRMALLVEVFGMLNELPHWNQTIA